MTNEEKRLLPHLNNTSEQQSAETERCQMQEALRKYQGDVKKISEGTNYIGAVRTSNFTAPVAPSPPTSRHFNDEYSLDDRSTDSKKNIKLSSDSGLGSTDLGEQSSWKNGKVLNKVFYFQKLQGVLNPLTFVNIYKMLLFH